MVMGENGADANQVSDRPLRLTKNLYIRRQPEQRLRKL
jgi:hypothetical protein